MSAVFHPAVVVLLMLMKETLELKFGDVLEQPECTSRSTVVPYTYGEGVRALRSILGWFCVFLI